MSIKGSERLYKSTPSFLPHFGHDQKVTEEIFREVYVARKFAICITSSLPYQCRSLIPNLQEPRQHFGMSPWKRNCFSTGVDLKKNFVNDESWNLTIKRLQVDVTHSPVEEKLNAAFDCELNYVEVGRRHDLFPTIFTSVFFMFSWLFSL